jgi:hypothetical protein
MLKSRIFSLITRQIEKYCELNCDFQNTFPVRKCEFSHQFRHEVCVCVQATPQMTEQSDQDNRFRIDKEKAETPNISPIPNVLMRREIDPPLVR